MSNQKPSVEPCIRSPKACVMSIDHNYAREKTQLLLRDLSNYNAGEFWREMSRIASGATASIHAEGLKAERDALADSNTQLMQQNEAQIRMNAKLMHERDALAAYVERIKVARHKRYPRESFGLGEWLDGVYEAIDDTFEASTLARRDLIRQAQALEEAAADTVPAMHNMKHWLLSRANDLRQQAEGHQ
ncbi:hypothetical protein FF32_15910 [Halomonas campaniensis]|nr:hypothetical protein FF32_15910 [Halomonas campaniensis]